MEFSNQIDYKTLEGNALEILENPEDYIIVLQESEDGENFVINNTDTTIQNSGFFYIKPENLNKDFDNVSETSHKAKEDFNVVSNNKKVTNPEVNFYDDFDSGSGTKIFTKLITPILYNCPHCSYSSSKKYLLTRHLSSHSTEQPYQCSYCSKKFKTVWSLRAHKYTHEDKKPYPCSHCTAIFRTSGELGRHICYKHTFEKPHRCPECDYATVELSKLKRHIRCHTGERPYQCRHCTYASPDSFKLKRHIRTHTGEKPYQCDLCKMRFTQSNSLKKHRNIHYVSERPVFLCPFCPSKCGRISEIRMHLKNLHSENGKHKCNRCGNVYKDRYSYKVHVKSHKGEKCFKCIHCPYAAESLAYLKTHQYRHTGECPFACEVCGQKFKQKQLLRRHFNLYHNPGYSPPPPKEKNHECTLCSRKFANKGNLIRHLERHKQVEISKDLESDSDYNDAGNIVNEHIPSESLLSIGGEEEYVVIHVVDSKDNPLQADMTYSSDTITTKMNVDTYFGFVDSDVEI